LLGRTVPGHCCGSLAASAERRLPGHLLNLGGEGGGFADVAVELVVVLTVDRDDPYDLCRTMQAQAWSPDEAGALRG
jgi:hypothetical protein